MYSLMLVWLLGCNKDIEPEEVELEDSAADSAATSGDADTDSDADADADTDSDADADVDADVDSDADADADADSDADVDTGSGGDTGTGWGLPTPDEWEIGWDSVGTCWDFESMTVRNQQDVLCLNDPIYDVTYVNSGLGAHLIVMHGTAVVLTGYPDLYTGYTPPPLHPDACVGMYMYDEYDWLAGEGLLFMGHGYTYCMQTAEGNIISLRFRVLFGEASTTVYIYRM